MADAMGQRVTSKHPGGVWDAHGHAGHSPVLLFHSVMETTGGIGHPGRAFLGRLANMGDPKKGGARDNTQYTCWTAPSFAAHHGMCISAECVYADALLLSLGAMRMKSACARA